MGLDAAGARPRQLIGHVGNIGPQGNSRSFTWNMYLGETGLICEGMRNTFKTALRSPSSTSTFALRVRPPGDLHLRLG